MEDSATVDSPIGKGETRRATGPVTDPVPAIEVSGLTRVYGGSDGSITAVDDLSFTIESGTIVGLLGPNGAGKTTLIKSMLGLIVPTSGRIAIHGTDIHAQPDTVYARVGAVLEGARNTYWRLTVRENLKFFSSLSGRSVRSARSHHDDLLEWLDLEDKADETVNELSRGMKQKVSLACTLAREPDVLFLDEPTLGLDVESSFELRRKLRRMVDHESMTIVLSSHDMEVIEELCDRVIIMEDGTVIADDTVENLTNVFDSTVYEITVEGRVSDRVRERVERTYAVRQWEEKSNGDTQIGVTLSDGTLFYDFIDALSISDQPIVSVETTAPELESVFLELTTDAQ